MAKIAFRDSSFVISYLDQVLVSITEGDATLEAVDAWSKHVEMGGRAYPGGVLLLFVIGDTAVVPSGPVRARANEMFRSIKGSVRIMSTAVEGIGFATATKRAAFALISRGSLGAVPTKVHGDIGSAANWLAAEAATLGIRCASGPDIAKFARALPRPEPSPNKI
jgi:hypothetical protein